MISAKVLFSKIQSKIWTSIIVKFRHTKFYVYLYSSYWHYLFSKKSVISTPNDYFYAAQPNKAAGIGHQLANWISGFWWAKQFGLLFAHLPFSNSKWESFLGLGESNEQVEDLINLGYKKVLLPLFNENNNEEIDIIKKIIQSYSNQKVVFIAEQDQGYANQYGVISELKNKFNSAKARINDKIVYDKNQFNIAVHVRRTVIIDGKTIPEDDAAQKLRWLSNDYYEKVLVQVLENIKMDKPIAIWLFSTGKAEEFASFAKYGEIHFCSDMDEYQSFAHLVYADLLITSKSSFSYKPALMNDGIKICPRNFWHGYPDSKDWILVENDGTFDVSKLNDVI